MNVSVTPLVGHYAVRNGQLFYVHKDKSCSCGESHCLHVQAVADYLRRGGLCAPAAVTPMVSCVRVEWSADNVHLVREDVARETNARLAWPACSCGQANCPAIRFALKVCPVCGTTRIDSQFCPADASHYQIHWIARLQAAQRVWHNRLHQDPYYRQIAFQSETERRAFLEAHQLTYAASA